MEKKLPKSIKLSTLQPLDVNIMVEMIYALDVQGAPTPEGPPPEPKYKGIYDYVGKNTTKSRISNKSLFDRNYHWIVNFST